MKPQDREKLRLLLLDLMLAMKRETVADESPDSEARWQEVARLNMVCRDIENQILAFVDSLVKGANDEPDESEYEATLAATMKHSPGNSACITGLEKRLAAVEAKLEETNLEFRLKQLELDILKILAKQ